MTSLSPQTEDQSTEDLRQKNIQHLIVDFVQRGHELLNTPDEFLIHEVDQKHVKNMKKIGKHPARESDQQHQELLDLAVKILQDLNSISQENQYMVDLDLIKAFVFMIEDIRFLHPPSYEADSVLKTEHEEEQLALSNFSMPEKNMSNQWPFYHIVHHQPQWWSRYLSSDRPKPTRLTYATVLSLFEQLKTSTEITGSMASWVEGFDWKNVRLGGGGLADGCDLSPYPQLIELIRHINFQDLDADEQLEVMTSTAIYIEGMGQQDRWVRNALLHYHPTLRDMFSTHMCRRLKDVFRDITKLGHTMIKTESLQPYKDPDRADSFFSILAETQINVQLNVCCCFYDDLTPEGKILLAEAYANGVQNIFPFEKTMPHYPQKKDSQENNLSDHDYVNVLRSHLQHRQRKKKTSSGLTLHSGQFQKQTDQLVQNMINDYIAFYEKELIQKHLLPEQEKKDLSTRSRHKI